MTHSKRLAAFYEGRKGNADEGLAHSPARGKGAANEGPIISLPRAQQALQDFNSGNAEMKSRAARVLSEYMEERGAPVAKVGSGAVPASTGKTTDAHYTSTDLGAAAARTTTAERTRVATVFASEHSHGRERDAVTLLTHSKGWSAAAIIDVLGQPKASAAKAPSAHSVAAWDKVNAAIVQQDPFLRDAVNSGRARTPNASEPARTATSESRWDKANAKVAPAPTDDVWAHAYGSAAR